VQIAGFLPGLGTLRKQLLVFRIDLFIMEPLALEGFLLLPLFMFHMIALQG
jgi:hypothetical protein